MIRRDQIQYCDELPKRTASYPELGHRPKPGETNARSACLDILVQDNSYFIMHALAGQWDYHELERLVLARANEQKPNTILIEDVGFGTALISAAGRGGFTVVPVQP